MHRYNYAAKGLCVGLALAVSATAADVEHASTPEGKQAEQSHPTLQKPARLLNLDTPHVRGEYFVVFKKDAELIRIPQGAAKILGNTLPTTDASAGALAAALAQSAKAQLVESVTLRTLGRRGFYVKNMTEAAARELANDPRIDRIEAVPITTINAVQTTGDVVTGLGNRAP